MREVTLYSTNKQSVMSYDMQTVKQYHQIPPQMLPVRNSSVVLDKQEVEIKHLPVERFCWSDGKGNYTREIFAAFDEELREIIGCSQEKFKRDVQEATDRRVKHQYTQLLAVKDDYKTLVDLSPWCSMVWAIKKIWRKK